MPSNSFKSTSTLYHQLETWIAPLHQGYSSTMRFLQIEAYWQIGQLLTLESRLLSKAQKRHLRRDVVQYLSPKHGKRYHLAWAKNCVRMYSAYPDRSLLADNLTWTHYRALLRVKERAARLFYTKEAATYQWSSMHLQRQIKARHYERYLESPQPFLTDGCPNKAYLIKDMYILEFLDFAKKHAYLERDLEDALAEKLQQFILELGNGYAFVARQKRMVTVTGKQFYMDLVFYHYILRCFVIIELKAGELTHRDIGQLDMYVRMFDHCWKAETDNPTIGILFCSDIDPTIRQYSVLPENDQLYAACYRFDIPDKPVLTPHVQAALRRVGF